MFQFPVTLFFPAIFVKKAERFLTLRPPLIQQQKGHPKAITQHFIPSFSPILHLSTRKSSPFTRSKHSFYNAKGLLLPCKRATIASPKHDNKALSDTPFSAIDS
nr:hypothetical protein [uncultured Prevotella sp.]